MYETHYGLTGRPFQLTPDPRFWFDTATHKKAMAYLGYGLSQGEGFIVITGDIGAGKTTLVGHLTATIDADRLNVIRIVSTQIVADDLLRTVCAGLGIDADGLTKAAMLSAIERGLHAVARGGRRTLLIVDEAQALPVDSLEELRMLSNFQAGGHAMLQIFLLGQPEFREKLHGDGLEQLRQRVIAMHHLGPMEADELEPYLVHRLSVCGWTGRPRFRTDALATIYAWSGGIPRRINNLVSRVLLHGAIEGIDTFAAADVLAVADDLAVDGMTGADSLPTDVMTRAAGDPDPIVVPDADADARQPTPAHRPIQSEIPIDQAAPTVVPIVAETPVETPPAPVAADAPVEMRPVEISTTPRLFDPVQLRGRRSILAPVDAAPEGPVEPAPHVQAAPEPEPAPAPEPDPAPEAPAPTVMEWPLREPTATPRPDPAPVADLDLARRLAAIDRRMEEQDEALRRVLTLMVDWMENGRGDAGDLRGKVG